MALAIGLMASAQVKIGTAPETINDASLLELESSTQGLLLPRVALVNTTTRTLVGSASIQGMTVYNTANTGDVTEGLYTHDGTKWVKVGVTASSIPTWRDYSSSSDLLILASDGNNFIRLTSGVTNVTLPIPTTDMIGKVFTVFNLNGATSPLIISISPILYPYITTNVPNVNTLGGYQFITDGTNWYNTGSN